MLKDILLWTLAAILPFLIVLKNDKQMVHVLEGKLFRRGRYPYSAKLAYSRHKKPASVLLFAGGWWLAATGLLLLGTGPAGIAVAISGAVCGLLGVLARMRTVCAADKDVG
jgi:hypothetical protein